MGEQSLQRMKANARGYVELCIGMMHLMNTPQQRHRVVKAMLAVADEIKHKQPNHASHRKRHAGSIQNTKAAVRHGGGDHNGTGPKEQHSDCVVAKPKPGMVAPAPDSGCMSLLE